MDHPEIRQVAALEQEVDALTDAVEALAEERDRLSVKLRGEEDSHLESLRMYRSAMDRAESAEEVLATAGHSLGIDVDRPQDLITHVEVLRAEKFAADRRLRCEDGFCGTCAACVESAMRARAEATEKDRDEALAVLSEEVKSFLVMAARVRIAESALERARAEGEGWMREALQDSNRAARYRSRLARVLDLCMRAGFWARRSLGPGKHVVTSRRLVGRGVWSRRALSAREDGTK